MGYPGALGLDGGLGMGMMGVGGYGMGLGKK